MPRASVFAWAAASGCDQFTASRKARIDEAGNWTSQSPSRQDFSALMSSGSSVSALRSAAVAASGSSRIAR